MGWLDISYSIEEQEAAYLYLQSIDFYKFRPYIVESLKEQADQNLDTLVLPFLSSLNIQNL